MTKQASQSYWIALIYASRFYITTDCHWLNDFNSLNSNNVCYKFESLRMANQNNGNNSDKNIITKKMSHNRFFCWMVIDFFWMCQNPFFHCSISPITCFQMNWFFFIFDFNSANIRLPAIDSFHTALTKGLIANVLCGRSLVLCITL